YAPFWLHISAFELYLVIKHAGWYIY
ncbi:hypothetical protein, partial [Plasmodium yoelii yoelii]